MTAALDHEILLGKKLSKRSSLVAKPTIRSSRIYKVFMCNHTITKGVSSCEMKYYMVSMMSTIVGASIFLVNNHFHFRFFIYPFFLLLPSTRTLYFDFYGMQKSRVSGFVENCLGREKGPPSFKLNQSEAPRSYLCSQGMYE